MLEKLVRTMRYRNMNRVFCNFITQIIQLEREIASATQGYLSVVDYFTKLQMLWDELVQLRDLPECTYGSACTCNVAKATSDLVEERHLMQFLMGLNDEYDNVRSQMLVMEPLPNINRAYHIVLRVERQHQVHTNLNDSREGVALYAGHFNRNREDQFRGQNKKRGTLDKRGMKCDGCDKIGHDKSTCFKIHGVPD
ncbi:UNVERIFIED_CONTAM: hypothetical protein Sradi_3994200 [Sesamum radiatum]|uniref:Retrotransposon gag domain-containing protein n=1 Tax=Sesamum radiatum TaxID=300843 RepID=A0AAW2PK69_SESRA